jgi:hypothetical protein
MSCIAEVFAYVLEGADVAQFGWHGSEAVVREVKLKASELGRKICILEADIMNHDIHDACVSTMAT